MTYGATLGLHVSYVIGIDWIAMKLFHFAPSLFRGCFELWLEVIEPLSHSPPTRRSTHEYFWCLWCQKVFCTCQIKSCWRMGEKSSWWTQSSCSVYLEKSSRKMKKMYKNIYGIFGVINFDNKFRLERDFYCSQKKL